MLTILDPQSPNPSTKLPGLATRTTTLTLATSPFCAYTLAVYQGRASDFPSSLITA